MSVNDGYARAWHTAAIRDHNERVIADLRDRLKVMTWHVCNDCGCAPVDKNRIDRAAVCVDCGALLDACIFFNEGFFAASISRGMRALVGRKILSGC